MKWRTKRKMIDARMLVKVVSRNECCSSKKRRKRPTESGFFLQRKSSIDQTERERNECERYLIVKESLCGNSNDSILFLLLFFFSSNHVADNDLSTIRFKKKRDFLSLFLYVYIACVWIRLFLEWHGHRLHRIGEQNSERRHNPEQVMTLHAKRRRRRRRRKKTVVVFTGTTRWIGKEEEKLNLLFFLHLSVCLSMSFIFMI